MKSIIYKMFEFPDRNFDICPLDLADNNCVDWPFKMILLQKLSLHFYVSKGRTLIDGFS